MRPRLDAIPQPAGSGTGSLYAAGFSAVGPDPDAALTMVGAQVMVCLLTPHEIDLRFPDYADWLVDNRPHRALWLPTDDGDVTDDDAVLELVTDVVGRLREGLGVVTHCGAGMARTSVIGILAMVALGAEPRSAATKFRAARPGGGPDGIAQASQIERLLGSVRSL